MEFLSSITIQAHLILINSWLYPILWIKELTPRTSYLDSPCHPMQFCPLKWISLPQPRAGKWWHRHCRGREGENCSLCTPLAAKIVCRWEGISLGMHGAQLNHLIFSFTDTCSHMFYELRFPFQTFRYFLQKYNNLEIWPDSDTMQIHVILCVEVRPVKSNLSVYSQFFSWQNFSRKVDCDYIRIFFV